MDPGGNQLRGKSFSIEKHFELQTEREKELQRVQKEYEAVGQEIPVTNAEARRLYKIGLAKFVKNRLKDNGNEEEDCLRCILIRQGSFFIPVQGVCTCILQIPDTPTDSYEEKLIPLSTGSTVTEAFSMEDHKNLAISVALGSLFRTEISLTNADPAIRIAQRVLDQAPLMETSDHKCVTIEKPETNEKHLWTRSNEKTDCFVGHAIIYAPSGFGKTHLQRELSRSGKFILDTDDVPSIEVKHVAKALQWTSVLTNRLDLLDPSFLTIVFRPVTAKVLHERTSLRNRLTPDDAEYWHSKHVFPSHKHILVCHVKDSFVADWFDFERKVATEERQDDDVLRKARRCF